MVDSVANVLLETLRDVLIEEVMFLSGLSDQVKKVERDLRTIHGLLMDADRKRSDSRALRDCITDLKELALEAENVLETYAVQVKSKREGKSLKKKLQRLIGIMCECYSVHQAGNKIDDITSRLADLTSSLQSLSGGDQGGGSSTAAHEERQQPLLMRLRDAHEIEQHFVGKEKDIQHLVSMLKDEPRSVISICGMGGIGKTTLATKIYHHQDVQGHFDGRAWVCVTQQFRVQAILRNIFWQVDNKRPDIETMKCPELVRELHSVLEQGKCLIVIDDICETSHWEILEPAFPTNCKVVPTTRNENITTSQECDVYKLDFLSEDEGWELLGKIALPTYADATEAVLESKSKQFEVIGRQIVEKCGRLPLAISVIGGVLRQKQEILLEWEKVSTHIDSYMKRGEGIGNDTRVKLVLDLSYDVLPYYLKPCFLYLSCFPMGHEIDEEELYRLWIAEGLISMEEKGKTDSLSDVAERYLAELAHRCMVQVEKHPYDRIHGKFTSCRLHDLMRDLCSSKAKEEKFIKRIDVSKHQHEYDGGGSISINRVAINLDDGDAASLCKSCVKELQHMRSFFVIFKNPFNMTRIHFQNAINFENSKYLRILVLVGFKLKDGKLPSTVDRLIHLRYLSLNGCNVDELPQHVCDLPYLHTLDLRVWYTCIIKLPNLIWKMKRLRHLFLPEEIKVIGGDKLRLDGLNELETLEKINSRTACIADITNLMNLRKLRAAIEEDNDSLSKIVEYMSTNQCRLRQTNLTVNYCDFGRNVAKKMLMSHSLSRLEINNCEIEGSFPCYEQGMCHSLFELIIYSKFVGDVHVVEKMGKYPVLKYLELQGEAEEEVMETQMSFGANSFPELKRLFIIGLSNLKKWEVEKGAMPKLEELHIDFQSFGNLEKLPDGLRYIPTLRDMKCWSVSSELVSRMSRGGENGEGAGLDYAKFSHIPNISIW